MSARMLDKDALLFALQRFEIMRKSACFYLHSIECCMRKTEQKEGIARFGHFLHVLRRHVPKINAKDNLAVAMRYSSRPRNLPLIKAEHKRNAERNFSTARVLTFPTCLRTRLHTTNAATNTHASEENLTAKT